MQLVSQNNITYTPVIFKEIKSCPLSPLYKFVEARTYFCNAFKERAAIKALSLALLKGHSRGQKKSFLEYVKSHHL